MGYRVAHGGTGLTGREALRGIINDPVLDLIAVLVTTPAKVGVDAGSLCGLPDVGLLATDDVEAIIDARPDCFCYCGTAVRREEQAIEDMARLLRAGINVVTISTIPMVYSPSAPHSWRDTIESACQEGQSSFYATGSEPGVASLNIPTALLAGAGQVDSYRMDEYALGLDETYPIWEVLHESMGFGKPDGHVPTRIASGKVNHDWETVVRYIAEILGYELDDIDLDWETLKAPNDLDTNVGVLAAGTICAHRWQLAGKVDGKAVVSVQYFATVSSTRGRTPGRVRLRRRPALSFIESPVAPTCACSCASMLRTGRRTSTPRSRSREWLRSTPFRTSSMPSRGSTIRSRAEGS